MFDIAWRANRRNYALLVGSVEDPRKHTLQSWLFLGGVAKGILVVRPPRERPRAASEALFSCP